MTFYHYFKRHTSRIPYSPKEQTFYFHFECFVDGKPTKEFADDDISAAYADYLNGYSSVVDLGIGPLWSYPIES